MCVLLDVSSQALPPLVSLFPRPRKKGPSLIIRQRLQARLPREHIPPKDQATCSISICTQKTKIAMVSLSVSNGERKGKKDAALSVLALNARWGHPVALRLASPRHSRLHVLNLLDAFRARRAQNVPRRIRQNLPLSYIGSCELPAEGLNCAGPLSSFFLARPRKFAFSLVGERKEAREAALLLPLLS